MNNNFERIESIQFKTELKLKLENPFDVPKSLLNFDYRNLISIIKQNISLSYRGVDQDNIENNFRFLSE